MKKTIYSSFVNLLFLFSTTIVMAQTHWEYAGENGPDHWAQLTADFSLCGNGKNQSPINLSHMVDSNLTPIQFNYTGSAQEIVNNGHTVQVNYQPGSSITIDNHIFELKQFHFHAPSENHIDGVTFPMEAHLVHADAQGNLAVIAVMFELGGFNTMLDSLWQKMPATVGAKKPLLSAINVMNLLPENKEYFRFNGSLTTPPCTEGVEWLVMKHPVKITQSQVSAFQQVMGHANNRPIQQVFARPILK